MDGDTSSTNESAFVGCHPWMEKCHLLLSSMDREMSSVDGEMSAVDVSVIRGCHPWMISTDGDDR